MSGGGSGGGGWEPRPPDCESFILRTHLNSPQAGVVRTLQVGQILEVQLQQQGGGRVIVVAVTAAGQVAGSITGTGLGLLIQCLQDGHDFVAVVENVTGGSVEVTIRPR
jgi:hypothetical protein